MKPSVTIAIPAYNEGKNIKSLLESLLRQKTILYRLEKIVISSDGSNDNTVEVVRSYQNPKIQVIDNHDRQGAARGLNQIIAQTKSDILVMLDADISIKSYHCINEIVRPIIVNKADLSSSAIRYLPGKSFVHNALATGMDCKQMLFDSIEDPNNIYHCFGLARGLSRRLYRNLVIPSSIGNDMYTYLYCLSKNLKFIYNKKAIVWYKLPSNVRDHLSQSKRFLSSGAKMASLFGAELVKNELTFKGSAILLATLRSLPIILTHPVSFFAYTVLRIYTVYGKYEEIGQAWVIAESSK